MIPRLLRARVPLLSSKTASRRVPHTPTVLATAGFSSAAAPLEKDRQGLVDPEDPDGMPLCCGSGCQECVLLEYYAKTGLNDVFAQAELKIESRAKMRRHEKELQLQLELERLLQNEQQPRVYDTFTRPRMNY
jgi:hypothetical protein